MEFSEVIEVLDRGSSVDVQSTCTFESLMIGAKTLERLKSNQFDKPSPVQAKAIPIGLLGRDMLVQAKSGTGKTLVFSVLAVENLDLRASYVQKVIVTPTREISAQIKETIRKVAPSGARTAVCIGGSAHKFNQNDLKNTRPHIVIGTPGRIAQLVKLGSLNMSHVDFFVLDEADKLMDDVFRDDINYVINALPSIRQVAVFSATYPRNLDNLLSTFLRDAALVRFNADDVQLVGIKQYVIAKCHPMLEKLTHVLKSIRYVQALVFCDQIAKCEPIAAHLKSEGLDVTFVSSAMSQKDRQLAVDQLCAKRVKILVSSDLTARGIDADHVNLVVNVDAAANEETYFHRIGRAARFGAHGAAVTLLEDDKALKGFTALAYRGKVTVKRANDVVSLPVDLVKNLEFWSDLPYFIDFEKTRAPREPNDLSKVPDRKAAVEALKLQRNGKEATLKYDRNEMMAMRSTDVSPPQKPENAEELIQKTEEMSIKTDDKENEKEEKVEVKKTFKERLAELKAAKNQEKKQDADKPKVEEERKTKFKFVPTREKAKKKYYMRGELQHIRDAFSAEQWRSYAESKFDLSQEPFLDAFGAASRQSGSTVNENFGSGDAKKVEKK
uniref:RNA helicase n=1 Tax=Caenorhabditis tropicalis TaxID=1561998 RepID=A0A1I7ULV0_9PELO